MINFIQEFWQATHEDPFWAVVFWAWVAGLVMTVLAIIVSAIPERIQLRLVPILTAPAAIIQFIALFIMKWTSLIALLLLLIGAIMGYSQEDQTLLGGLWESAQMVLFIWGGPFLAAAGSLVITERNTKFTAARDVADKTRLAQQMLDEANQQNRP